MATMSSAVCLETEYLEPRLKTIAELHPVLMSAEDVVVLDIETTGLSPAKFAEIIEIGAVKLNIPSRKITGKFETLIQPAETFSLSPAIRDITNLTWGDLSDKPFIEDVLPSFSFFLGDTPIVAHNAIFDWPRFLIYYFRKCGLHATNEAICSMRLAKTIFPNRGRAGYNLESLCNLYGTPIIGHHRALVDAKWTASLFLRLLDEYRYEFADERMGFNGEDPLKNPLPSSIGTVDFNDLTINSLSFYAGSSKRHGPKIYVRTNFGKIHYSTRRRKWSVDELWTPENAPAQEWGKAIMDRVGVRDGDELVTFAMRTA